jgi:hypothetical protein
MHPPLFRPHPLCEHVRDAAAQSYLTTLHDLHSFQAVTGHATASQGSSRRIAWGQLLDCCLVACRRCVSRWCKTLCGVTKSTTSPNSGASATTRSTPLTRAFGCVLPACFPELLVALCCSPFFPNQSPSLVARPVMKTNILPRHMPQMEKKVRVKNNPRIAGVDSWEHDTRLGVAEPTPAPTPERS